MQGITNGKKSMIRHSPKRRSRSPKRRSKTAVKKSSFSSTLELVKKNKWFIVTLDGCGYCESAKKLLENKGKKFKTKTLDDSNMKEIYKSVDSLTGEYRYFPMVFYDGKFIGGYSELTNVLS